GVRAVPPAGGREEPGAVVVQRHQRGRGGRAPGAGVPGGAGPRGAHDVGAVAGLAAGSEGTDAGGVPVVVVVHERAPAALAGRDRGVAQLAAGRPGAAAVERAVQPDLVGRDAVV